MACGVETAGAAVCLNQAKNRLALSQLGSSASWKCWMLQFWQFNFMNDFKCHLRPLQCSHTFWKENVEPYLAAGWMRLSCKFFVLTFFL